MSELFIDGEWRDAIDAATREIRCPADGASVATVSEGAADDASAAVRAARKTFDEGPLAGTTPSPEHGALLTGLGHRLEAEREDPARLVALDTGQADRRGADRQGRHHQWFGAGEENK